jgi:4-hydroxybutyryl-CoA dehydratase/vinylacetyl-CoA-Delta-isomerase
MLNVDQLWAPYREPIVTAEDYSKSLQGRGLNVFYLGERVDEPADHPVIRPSVNAVAETYRLASEHPELGGARTENGKVVNRFLHIANKPEDLLAKHDMQRELGRRTGTCFQRCVGMDARLPHHHV